MVFSNNAPSISDTGGIARDFCGLPGGTQDQRTPNSAVSTRPKDATLRACLLLNGVAFLENGSAVWPVLVCPCKCRESQCMVFFSGAEQPCRVVRMAFVTSGCRMVGQHDPLMNHHLFFQCVSL
eukprot:s144_g2.t1